MGSIALKDPFKKIEYSIKISNEMTNDNYISNLKYETLFLVHF
jgi:hypothetical protein